MTQAIVNNLNIQADNFSSVNNDVSMDAQDVSVDFENILSQKTLGDLKTCEEDAKTVSQVVSEVITDAISETVLGTVAINITEASLQTEGFENSTVTDDEAEVEGKSETITDEDLLVKKEDILTLLPTVDLSMTNIRQVSNQIQRDDFQNNDQAYEAKIEFSLNKESIKYTVNQDTGRDFETQNYVKDAEQFEKKEFDERELLTEKMVDKLNIESIESNLTDGSASGDIMQNQTPQEQALKVVLNENVKFEDASLETSVEVKANNVVEVNPSKIIEQISKQMESSFNNSRVNIVLNPERLGRVSLQIINSKEGLSAQFTVTTNEARDLLLKGIDGLKDSLLAQGVNVDNVSVKVNDTEESQTNHDWTEQEGSRGGNKQQGSHKQKDDKKHFEQMMFNLNNDDKV